MKRRWWVAGVVAALVVGMSAAFWDEIWLTVAYRRHDIADPRLPSAGRMVCYEKRFEFLPGEASFFPNQLCSSCYFGEHQTEYLKAHEGDILADLSNEALKLPSHWSCWMALDTQFLVECADGFEFWCTPKWTCTCPLRITDPDHP